MARVLVATPLLDGCLDSLSEHLLIEGEVGSDAAADALICDPTQRVDAAALERMPGLRLIAVAGAGSDAVDHRAAGARGVPVLTSGEGLIETTADIAFGLIISASRLMHDAEARLRAGAWEGWRFIEDFGRDIHGATLGLVGFGSIAQAVARRAAGFEMNVLHHTRHPTGRPGWTRELDELLESSDVLSIHVPLDESTHRLIDRRRIGLLKASAVLVNTARGAVIDEEALAEALHEGRLFAAGLDVYEREPELSPLLLSAPRTVLLPHVGSATLRARRAMLSDTAAKVAAFLEREA
jgi:glyoxylate reductase